MCSTPPIGVTDKKIQFSDCYNKYEHPSLESKLKDNCYAKFFPGYGVIQDKKTLLNLARILTSSATTHYHKEFVTMMNHTTEDNLNIMITEDDTPYIMIKKDDATKHMDKYDYLMLQRIQKDESPTEMTFDKKANGQYSDTSLSMNHGSQTISYDFKLHTLSTQQYKIAGVLNMFISPITKSLFIYRKNSIVLLETSGDITTYDLNSQTVDTKKSKTGITNNDDDSTLNQKGLCVIC